MQGHPMTQCDLCMHTHIRPSDLFLSFSFDFVFFFFKDLVPFSHMYLDHYLRAAENMCCVHVSVCMYTFYIAGQVKS